MQIWPSHSKVKNGSSYIFTPSETLPIPKIFIKVKIPKIFIKVVRGVQALEVINFQSSRFQKAQQYSESPNHLQILPGIKVWSWY